jgi:hypothetical protein
MLTLSMGNKVFKVIKGTVPILLSAPHVNPHRRPSLTLSYKWGEKNTEKIVNEVCANTGCWGILQTEETSFDPNYHKLEDNPYKGEVKKIIKKEEITKFIDIHGLNDKHRYDLAVYYQSKFFNSINLANDVVKALDKGKLKGLNSCILRFKEDVQEELGEYVASVLRIPSVQLEIARYIREDEGLRNAFIENLSAYIIV